MSPAVLELDALAWLITFSPCMSLSPAVHDPRTEVGMLLDTRLSTQSILLHDYQLNRMLLVTLKSRVHSSHDLALTLPSSRTVTPVSYFGIFVQVLTADGCEIRPGKVDTRSRTIWRIDTLPNRSCVTASLQS
jgi:hypothetical protein